MPTYDQWGTETSPNDPPSSGGGSGGNVQPKDNPNITTYTDPEGRAHVSEDYSSEGGGKYDTVVSDLTGSYRGSGYQKEAVGILSDKTVQGDILAEAGADEGKAAELEKVGIISYTKAAPATPSPRVHTESPFGKGIIRKENFPGASSPSFPASRVGRNESEFAYHPKYGQLIPADIAQERRTERQNRMYREATPEDITLSKQSRGFFTEARNISEGIRGLKIDTGSLPSEIRESPGYQGSVFVFQKGRESVARVTEFLGTIPGTTEIFGKTALKDPGKVPGMIAIGGLEFVGGTARQAEQDPAQLTSDLIVTAGIFKGAGKIKSGISDTIKFTGKKYVPPETIIEPQVLSGAERFPLAPRGTTGAELVQEFNKGKYRLPGTEGKTGGWHATPEEFPKETLTQVGTSEGKGLYISPTTSPHFWKISKNYKLFGFDNPPDSPTGIWLETEVTRSPPNTRMAIATQNRFLTEEALKGSAFISAAFEKGIKPEKEAIVPPETPISRIRFDQYTKFKGKKVGLMEYTSVQEPLPEPPADYPFDFTGGEHGISVTRSNNKLILVEAGVAIRPSKPQKEETFGELSKRQARISKEYAEYKEPIITPDSLAVSLFRSKIRSSRRVTLKSSRKISTTSSPKELISSGNEFLETSSLNGLSDLSNPSAPSNPGNLKYQSDPGYSSPIASLDFNTVTKPKKLPDPLKRRSKEKKENPDYFRTPRENPLNDASSMFTDDFDFTGKKKKKKRRR